MMQENESSTCSEELASVKNLEAEFDVDTAKELAKAFLEDTEPLIPRMQEALSRGDCELLRSSAHMLKGCARALQASKCEKASSAVESFAGDGDLENVGLTLQVLVNVYNETAQFLRIYIA